MALASLRAASLLILNERDFVLAMRTEDAIRPFPRWHNAEPADGDMSERIPVNDEENLWALRHGQEFHTL